MTDTELMRLLRRCGHKLHHLFPHPISQNRILLILYREGPMKQRELVERMNIQPGSLSEIIAKVEASGCIERKRSEDDKRNFELCLTDAGRERAEIFERERDEKANELFAVLGDDDKQKLGEILGVLLDNRSDGCCCRKSESGKENNNA